MTRAFVFPGQGSQTIGMGRDLYDAFAAARRTFEEVDDALAQKLTTLMFTGAEADLNLTENTQPALMAVSMAVVNVLKEDGKIDFATACACMAGHSLGEYSALTAAGAFSLADAAKLLRRRGQAMQQAMPVGEGAMAAILGLDFAAVEQIAGQVSGPEICAAANDNAPGQVVISGHKGAVAAAIALATQCGAKRAIELPVSAPFHCALMQPAADAMRDALGRIAIQPPVVPIIANITAAPVTAPADIRRLLIEQVTGRVRWRESVGAMKYLGVDEAIELGAGKVLSGLIKRSEPDIKASSVGTVAQVEELIKLLS